MKLGSIDISTGENESQAFVQNLDNSYEIAKTLVAFANSNGGKLIIGLKSNGKIVGTFPNQEIEKLTNIIKGCVPELSYQTEVKEVGFRLILIVCVEKSITPPHFIVKKFGKSEAYIRVEKQNIVANKILLQSWKYKDENGGLPAIFSPEELKIIDIIKSNPKTSHTHLCKKSKMAIDTVDYCLVRLINWNVIQIKITDNSCFFSITL